MNSVARVGLGGGLGRPANGNHEGRQPARSDDFAGEIARLRAGLLTRALFMTQDPWTAEDLVQEALERAIVGRARFQRGTHLMAWLSSILRNLFIDACRRTATRARIDPEPEIDHVPPEELDSPFDLLRGDDVIDALDALEPPQREVFTLACLEGLSYQEIAARSGVSTNTVGTRLLRAKRKLRRLLEELYQERCAPRSRSGSV